jgi:hypothetical protein
MVGRVMLGAVFVDGGGLVRPFGAGVRGVPSILDGLVAAVRGVPRGIENAGLKGFGLWVGVGAAPDLTAAPDVTGATLPLVYTLAADGEYWFVVQARNAHGVWSGNVAASRLRVEWNDEDEVWESVPLKPGAVAALRVDVRGREVTATADVLEDPDAGVTSVEFQFEWMAEIPPLPPFLLTEVAIVGVDVASTGRATARAVSTPPELKEVTVRARLRNALGEGGAWSTLVVTTGTTAAGTVDADGVLAQAGGARAFGV